MTRSIYLTFFTSVSISLMALFFFSFLLLLKNSLHPLSSLSSSSFFLPRRGPVPPPPSAPPALFQCLFKQFHSHRTLPWLCWTLPLPISHGHALYVYLCISVLLSQSFLFMYTSPLLYPSIPSLFLLVLPTSLDILRFRVALKTSQPPSVAGAF